MAIGDAAVPVLLEDLGHELLLLLPLPHAQDLQPLLLAVLKTEKDIKRYKKSASRSRIC